MNCRSVVLCNLVVCAMLMTSLLFAGPPEKAAYLGEWSNGHGDTLVITEKAIRFAQDQPIPYRDLTRATDGKTFALQITAIGEVNAFAQKFLAVDCDDDEMRMIGYTSSEDLLKEKNPGSNVTWYRDKDPE